MAIGSGMAAQIGWAVETTAGTVATPTAFNPLLSESITIERARLESAGIIASARVLKSGQWNGGNITVDGDIQLELYNRGLGKLFRAMFGAVNTTGSGPYTHVFTPGDLSDDVLTVQVGLPATGGTVHPKTIAGCAISSWEMACAAGEIVTLGATVAAMNGHIGSRVVTDGATTNADATVTSVTGAFGSGDIGKPISGTGIPAGATIAAINSSTSVEISANATATATGLTVTIGTPLASASYLASQYPMKFAYGSISLFGSAVANVRSATISCENTLADDRWKMGSYYRSLPIEAGLREYTGELEVEFQDLTQWDRYTNGSEGALSLVFAPPGVTDTVTIAGNFRYDPSTRSVGGREILVETVPIKFIASSTDASAITATLVNADSTP